MSPIRCMVISDTHDQFPDTTNLPSVDVLLHCGDMSQIGGLSEYRRAIAGMQKINAELKLVIAGNHDISLDPTWRLENLDEDEDDPNEPLKAKKLFEDAQGIFYLEEGLYSFQLRSDTSFTIYASPYTLEFHGYAFAYDPEEGHFSSVPESVDILMTHGPPKLDIAGYKLDINHKSEPCGCPHLAKAMK